MDKNKISRLISFDDESDDISTGFVSATNVNESPINGSRFIIWLAEYMSKKGYYETDEGYYSEGTCFQIKVNDNEFNESDLCYTLDRLDDIDDDTDMTYEETLNEDCGGDGWYILIWFDADLMFDTERIKTYTDDFSVENSFDDFVRFVNNGGLTVQSALGGPEELNVIYYDRCMEDAENEDEDEIIDRLGYDPYAEGRDTENIADTLYEKEVKEPVRKKINGIMDIFRNMIAEYRRYCNNLQQGGQ